MKIKNFKLMLLLLVSGMLCISWSWKSKASQQNGCLINRRQICAAMDVWGRENKKPKDAVPTQKQLATYLKDQVFPACPSGGKYTLGSWSKPEITCSIPGHDEDPS